MAVETLTHVYTTTEKLKILLSEVFRDLMVDDLTGADITTAYSEAIDDATDYLNTYLLLIYDAADLATSRWVHGRCTWLAAYYLCQRRGNPPITILETRKEEIDQELQKVQEGKIQIPRIAPNANFTPGMSNYRVDDRFTTAKIRVQPVISTGGTYGQQDLDPRFAGYWDGF